MSGISSGSVILLGLFSDLGVLFWELDGVQNAYFSHYWSHSGGPSYTGLKIVTFVIKFVSKVIFFRPGPFLDNLGVPDAYFL